MKNIKDYFKNHKAAGYTAVILVSVLIGWGLRGCGGENSTTPLESTRNDEISGENVEIWTCSMHPQIRLPHPGKCPICGMDLIPADSGRESGLSGSQIHLTGSAVKLADIETVPVERKRVAAEIRLTGRVAYDETRVRSITSRVSGRIDKMFVDFAGIDVRKGAKLVLIYSPELLSAQRELQGAYKLMRDVEKTSDASLYEIAVKTYESAKAKLLLFGITQQQIDDILKSDNISEHIVIYSPSDGIVLEKKALEGEYVEAGAEIYKVAELSQVWVLLDAYESDIEFLRLGLAVRFQAESYPGRNFTGTVVFVDPVMDDKTRTVGVRVNAPNPGYALKPGMFVRSVLEAEMGSDERTAETSSLMMWTCQMDPQIIRDSPGKCPICGMDLVKKMVPGSAKPKAASLPPLVIPATAPLITGKRAVVYVKMDGDGAVFEGREIELGPRAGDYYIVKSGLMEGELVVVKGNFKIDSALQIKARRSMMSPEGKAPVVHHH